MPPCPESIPPDERELLPTEEPSARPRLEFLDGLRGLTAFGIVLTHIFWELSPSGTGKELPAGVTLLLHPVIFAGKVVVFFTLSGFCQMLSRGSQRPSKTLADFLWFVCQRASRLLPGYYAAVLFSLALIALFPALRLLDNPRWAIALPAFTPGALLPHLLLVQNLSPRWVFRISPPLWSLAVEWQLNLLFGALLLPLLHRGGRAALIATGALLGLLPVVLLPESYNFAWCPPWYVLMFCFGIVGGAWRDDPTRARQAQLLARVLAIPFALQVLAGNTLHERYPLLTDILTGLFIASLLTATAFHATHGRPSHTQRFLETPSLLWLGKLSYSLYLTHYPILVLCHQAIRAVLPTLSPAGQLGLLSVLAAPLTVLVASVFQRRIEHPLGSYLRRALRL